MNMTKGPLKLIQVSDVHLLADQEGELLGVKTNQSFQAVLEYLKHEKELMDCIILSGDLSQDGSEIAYKRIAHLLEPFNVPVYCIPGNHDDVRMMHQIYPYKSIQLDRHLLYQHWQIILLNSQKPGEVPGYLDVSEFKHLQACLEAYPKHHTLIFFHNHPFSIGVQWLDPLGLTNADEFFKIIQPYTHIKAIFFGHIHQAVEKVKQGIHCYAVPSTCIQFKPNQK